MKTKIDLQELANEFVLSGFTKGGRRTIHFFLPKHQWYLWDGQIYEKIDKLFVGNKILNYLKDNKLFDLSVSNLKNLMRVVQEICTLKIPKGTPEPFSIDHIQEITSLREPAKNYKKRAKAIIKKLLAWAKTTVGSNDNEKIIIGVYLLSEEPTEERIEQLANSLSFILNWAFNYFKKWFGFPIKYYPSGSLTEEEIQTIESRLLNYDI